MTKSEQARADALADAETLIRVHNGTKRMMACGIAKYDPRLHGQDRCACRLPDAQDYGINAMFQMAENADAGASAIEAARAAFCAVPGLRG